MYIEGPAGRLEARLDLAPAERSKTAVLCHPHPQYGGSMYDAVLDSVAEVLLSQGINCLRFNFRGVGNSAGEFDQGMGEVDDLIAVTDWVALEYPRDKLWLTGYSFGSSVVWRGLNKLKCERAILVAPPVGMMSFPAQQTDTTILGFAGDQDDFVDVEVFQSLLGDRGYLINGADHFFSGLHEVLKEQLTAALGNH